MAPTPGIVADKDFVFVRVYTASGGNGDTAAADSPSSTIGGGRPEADIRTDEL